VGHSQLRRPTTRKTRTRELKRSDATSGKAPMLTFGGKRFVNDAAEGKWCLRKRGGSALVGYDEYVSFLIAKDLRKRLSCTVLFMGQIGRELRWGIHYGKSYVGGTGREGGAYGRGRTKGGRAEGGPIRRADANGIERRNGE